MIDSTVILLIGVFGVVSLVLLFLLMLLYSYPDHTKRRVSKKATDFDSMVQESLDKMIKKSKSGIFNKKMIFTIFLASNVIFFFSGANTEMAKAILSIDGFMISFLIVAWSIVIRQAPLSSAAEATRDKIRASLEGQKIVLHIPEEEEYLDKEKLLSSLEILFDPFVQRLALRAAFRMSIISLIVSIGSSLCVFGLNVETGPLLLRAAYGAFGFDAIWLMLLGVYFVFNAFSIADDVLIRRELGTYQKSVSEFQDSIFERKGKSKQASV